MLIGPKKWPLFTDRRFDFIGTGQDRCTPKAWCERHNVDTASIPKWIYQLKHFFGWSANRDKDNYPKEFDVCKAAVAAKPDARHCAAESKLVTWLNMDDERTRVMEPVASAVLNGMENTSIASFECDGHFVLGFSTDPLLWQAQLNEMADQVAPHKIKAVPVIADSMVALDTWLLPLVPPPHTLDDPDAFFSEEDFTDVPAQLGMTAPPPVDDLVPKLAALGPDADVHMRAFLALCIFCDAPMRPGSWLL